jgi:inorganic pyrophosphatase
MNLIDSVSIGADCPQLVNAIVEIPKDTHAKYEYDPVSGLLRLDRCLISSMRYPASYGFIPQTLSDDGDPLDVLIYNSLPLQPLSLVEVRIIGALRTIDAGVNDYKLLGIPKYNPNKYNSIRQLDETFLVVCEDFFRHYKNNDPRKKLVDVNGWEADVPTIHQTILEKHNAWKAAVEKLSDIPNP